MHVPTWNSNTRKKVCFYSREADSDLCRVDSDWVEPAQDPERAGSNAKQRVGFAGMHSGVVVEPAQGLIELTRTGNRTVHGFWFRLRLVLILGVLRPYLGGLEGPNSRAWIEIKSKGWECVRHGLDMTRWVLSCIGFSQREFLIGPNGCI